MSNFKNSEDLFQNSIENTLNKIYQKKQSVQELLLLQEQSDLIKQIQDFSRKRKNNTAFTTFEEMSFEISEHSRTFNCSISGVNSRKNINRQCDVDDIEPALSEIYECCGKETYQKIRKHLKRKPTHFHSSSRLLKKYQENIQLTKENKKLMNENIKLKAEVRKLLEEVSLKQMQSSIKAKQIQLNFQRQERMIKYQIALLYKQKMYKQVERNLNEQEKYLQKDLFQSFMLKEKTNEDFSQILMQKKEIDSGFSQNESLKQFKANLQKERNYKQFQRDLSQKHCQSIHKIAEQLKASLE